MIDWKQKLDELRDKIAKPKVVSVDIDTRFLKIRGEWEVDERQQKAAWEIYVELVTRIATVELTPGEGLLREALSSLYQIFTETRQILRRYGPVVAKPRGRGNLTLGAISVTLLNTGLRPVLTKWHPLLMAYEATRKPEVSPPDLEAGWEYNQELRAILTDLQETMNRYSLLLAEAAGIPPVV